jgi:hypothetical protein
MNEYELRARLQQMAAYREICQAVRSGAGHTLFNAVLWLALTFYIYNAMGPHPWLLVYAALGLAELFVGLWKKFAPSVEAVLADGLVLLGFGGFILIRSFLAWQGIINWPFSPISVLLGVWWLSDAYNSFKGYGALRRAFPERPTRDQISWFNDLIAEIRAADPRVDELAVDIPSTPHWKGKLLGSTAFFVPMRGESVLVAGPGEFDILRENEDHGTGSRRAVFRLHGQPFAEFAIDDASWTNYQKWLAAHAGPGAA